MTRNKQMKRPAPGSVPTKPGVYLFRDHVGRVIYVGKAKSLRARTSNYFGPELHPRTRAMVEAAADLEWIVTSSEVEALHLEVNLIKEHRPRYNVRYRDDKSYPYLAVTLDEEYPRARVLRGQKRKGVRYYGPFAHAYAIRETLDLLLRTFPIRTCSDNKFQRHERQGRPCLLFHIEKCSGPCVREVAADEYAALVADHPVHREDDRRQQHLPGHELKWSRLPFMPPHVHHVRRPQKRGNEQRRVTGEVDLLRN